MSLQSVIDNIPELGGDAIAIGFCGLNESVTRFVWTNSHFTGLFGYAPGEVLGQPIEMIYRIAEAREITDDTRQRLSAGPLVLKEVVCEHKDGTPFWVKLSVATQPAADGQYTLSIYHNVDDLKSREQKAEQALAEHERLLTEVQGLQSRLITAINTIRDPFAIFDKDDRFVLWNDAYARAMTNNPEDIRVGMKISDALRLAVNQGRFPEAEGNVEEWLQTRRKNWARGRKVTEARINGRDVRIYRSVAPNGDTVILRVDVTEIMEKEQQLTRYAAKLEQANEEVAYKALHDELTGLGNRRSFEAALEAARARRRENGGEIAVLHIDLDRFKKINDTMGHDAGDTVLRVVAQRLKKVFREGDAIARSGGDEFLAVLECASDSDFPERAAERIVETLSDPVTFKGKLCRIGASVGVARTPLVGEDELLTTSDIALYQAKNGGRSRAASFDVALLEEVQNNKRLADELMRGIEAGEFAPYYQPQISAADLTFIGVEALARWKHPTRGLLTPKTFLNVARELDMLGEIDRAIFDRAIEDCSAAFAGGHGMPKLSFNVSARRVFDPAILDVASRVNAYPGRVAFELSESVFIEDDFEGFLFQLDALKEIGVSIEMDDFGSGHGSLVALTRIRPDRLKIDRRLVAPIPESRQAADLVKSILDIARSLDIAVTAEGVETFAHVNYLQELGCDALQGYYLSKPVTMSDLMRLPIVRTAPFVEGAA